MFLRFVILRRDGDSHREQGIFQAAYHLRDTNGLAAHEWDWLMRELAWFHMHLKSPAELRRSGTQRAICWFKPTAAKAIDRARAVCAVLETKDLHTTMLKTAEPGQILYEDGLQVVAFPPRRRRGPRRPGKFAFTRRCPASRRS